MKTPALLALADGSLFKGYSIGADGKTHGEVVFNTAMTGYQEILTDPSYAQQIVTLTYPHIGNTGVNPEDVESDRIQAAGLVIRDLPLLASNWRSTQSLDSYLRDNNIVAIAGIDTRRLTRILREKGAQAGAIVTGATVDAEEALAHARSFPGLKGADLAKTVSRTANDTWSQASWNLNTGYRAAGPCKYRVVAFDYGIKSNILRMLADRGCELTIVPAETPASEVLAMQPDGVFLANGPGDPEPCGYAITAISEVMERKVPLFGICLGHQLLALASGATTNKMKFGHHGANHPVLTVDSGTVMITSQNHGFAVLEDSLPGNLKATHKSLFDGSLQGIRRTDTPAFSFQGHPEASPGPHDVAPLFDEFTRLMDEYRASRQKTAEFERS